MITRFETFSWHGPSAFQQLRQGNDCLAVESEPVEKPVQDVFPVFYGLQSIERQDDIISITAFRRAYD